MHIISRRNLSAIAIILAAVVAHPTTAAEIASPDTFTFYTGRVSSEDTWHDVLLKPYSSNYTDTYLVSASYSHAYQEHYDGALRTEYEANLTYHLGPQDFWEVNLVPITLRWQRFPWSERLKTSVAFGLGLSYDFKFPEVEYQLENDTKQLLLFWFLEFTAGPTEGPWSAVVRLHHRSPGWGAMGVADGGSNAPSLGFRYSF